ncbi:MAG: Nif3-like dinuclear metal center hexameric protein [Chlorobi bacterium]|nr:Nif3-like dinuclear metal center hexameric protein [Chlorobiota bacterium]
MIISELISSLEQYAPLGLQESYDNSGLLIGNYNDKINQALVCLDVTPAVIDEAIRTKSSLIVAHHPIIFKGLKKINGNSLVERVIRKAIKNDICIYAMHTNLDNALNGVNSILASKLGITNMRILSPSASKLNKLVCFCPDEHAGEVRQALFDSGAGHIGNYDNCSYNLKGEGSFRALENTNPFVGEKGKTHFEGETRIETVVPDFKLPLVVKAMIQAHPYEEVAYDVYPLENKSLASGAGMIGELETEENIEDFLASVKNILGTKYLKHNRLVAKTVKKVAVCGGSGSFLIDAAARQKADVFITGDIKYHDYFEHQGEMTIVDAGHYETEQFTKELIHTILTKNFPNFAVRISETATNPVSFL